MFYPLLTFENSVSDELSNPAEDVDWEHEFHVAPIEDSSIIMIEIVAENKRANEENTRQEL